MQLFPKTSFDFISARRGCFLLSAVLLGGSAASLAVKGIKYGIDFTGGTIIQLSFEKPINLAELREDVEKSGAENASIQSFSGKPGEFTFSIRVPSDENQSAEALEKMLGALQREAVGNVFRVDRKEFVGPAVGKQLLRQALWAVLLSLGGIIIYLGFRFSNPIWGVAGIVALVHDVLATYGLFSLLGLEVDLLIVSAFLTIGGYSIHDTIIIFDRMREKMKVMRREPLGQVINESINETLSRTIITSGTVLAVVTILFLFGGKVLHNFAMAMVFGTLVGTYSSIAVAVPVVYEWVSRGARGKGGRST